MVEIALIWMSLDFTDDQSTLVQVKAWCRQATSRYLNQCWHRSLSSYGVTRPQLVNDLYRTQTWAYSVYFLQNKTQYENVSALKPGQNASRFSIIILDQKIYIGNHLEFHGNFGKVPWCLICNKHVSGYGSVLPGDNLSEPMLTEM